MSHLLVEPLAASDEIFIARADTFKFGEIENFFCRHTGEPGSGRNPDDQYQGLGYAARTVKGIVGIFMFSFLPSIVPGEHLCYLTGVVDPLYRRHRVGARLLTEALTAAKQAVARPVFIARLPDSLPDRGEEPITSFLGRFGFTEMDCDIHYGANLSGIQLSPEDSRFVVRNYKGADPLLNQAIVDLHRRAYRGQPGIADLTPELLAVRLADPRCRYELLYYEKQLAGYASFWIFTSDCYVDSLLAAQQYWGCGASDALANLIARRALKDGCKTLSTLCRSKNRSTINLMQRLGCRALKTTRIFWQASQRSDVSGS